MFDVCRAHVVVAGYNKALLWIDQVRHLFMRNNTLPFVSWIPTDLRINSLNNVVLSGRHDTTTWKVQYIAVLMKYIDAVY